MPLIIVPAQQRSPILEDAAEGTIERLDEGLDSTRLNIHRFIVAFREPIENLSQPKFPRIPVLVN